METERSFEVETNVERLRRRIREIIIPGSGKPELEELLEAEPQRDSAGVLRYLVTSGMAVELVTGYEREHHDLDLVIMDPLNVDQWELYGTDNVTPQQYWADMKFDPAFLEETVVITQTRKKEGISVEVVHPAILLVQKSSDAFGRPPREKDAADVAAIIKYWQTQERSSTEWDRIIEQSIEALPREERAKTQTRLQEAVG